MCKPLVDDITTHSISQKLKNNLKIIVCMVIMTAQTIIT